MKLGQTMEDEVVVIEEAEVNVRIAEEVEPDVSTMEGAKAKVNTIERAKVEVDTAKGVGTRDAVESTREVANARTKVASV